MRGGKRKRKLVLSYSKVKQEWFYSQEQNKFVFVEADSTSRLCDAQIVNLPGGT